MGRSFVATSSQRINLPVLAATAILTRVTFSLTFVFKSTNSGTSRLSLYGIDSDTSTPLLHLSLNDLTGNGGIRFARRDASSNFCDMRYNVDDINLCDGNWHVVTVVGRALNDLELFIDGVSKATNTTNVSGAGGTIQHTIIGSRFVFGGSFADFFDGTIAECMIHSVAMTLDQHQELAAQTKNAFTVTGDASKLIVYRPFINLGTGDLRNVAPGRLDDAAPTLTNAPASVDGPNGVVPWGMTEACDIGTVRFFSEPTTTLFAGSETSTDVDYLLREPSNIVHTPGDIGKEYKIYVAGTPTPYSSNDPSTILYYSSDLENWTKHGVVIAAATLPLEDTYVVIDPDDFTYHMWAENKTGRTNDDGIAHLTSPDGLDWTIEDLTALGKGSAGTFDEQDVSSPTVWVEGTPGSRTWYMLYEGRPTGATHPGRMGLASAASPSGHGFSKYGSNPVLDLGAGGTADSNGIICDDITKIDSTYWVLYHALAADGFNRMLRASSTDKHAWARGYTTGDVLTKAEVSYGLQNFRASSGWGRAVNYIDANSTPFKLMRGFGDVATQTEEWPALPAASFNPAWAVGSNSISIGLGLA